MRLAELLAEIEAALLDLEKAPQDREVIDRVFRALHTIKGSGGSCAFNDVSAFAHEVETFFDLVRKGKVKATKEFIALAPLCPGPDKGDAGRMLWRLSRRS